MSINLGWVPPLAGLMRDKLLRRQPQAAPTEYMSRLRSRKAEVGKQLDERRAAARFEPAPDRPISATALDETQGGTSLPPEGPKPGATLSPEKATEEDNYTSRLLKAKKKVWQDRKDPKEPS